MDKWPSYHWNYTKPSNLAPAEAGELGISLALYGQSRQPVLLVNVIGHRKGIPGKACVY